MKIRPAQSLAAARALTYPSHVPEIAGYVLVGAVALLHLVARSCAICGD